MTRPDSIGGADGDFDADPDMVKDESEQPTEKGSAEDQQSDDG
ncbi:hypothetical protein [Mycolicibacterium arenosum]|nr:hypothetical protein [Mycolicibacterium sp. CAU 1645]